MKSFSDNLTELDKNSSNYKASLQKLNEQNEAIASSSEKSQKGISELSNSFIVWDRVLEILKINLKGWTVALTGGLSIITAFLPEIIDLVGSFFKGKDAVAQMTDKLKGFNEVMKAANSDTAAQTAKLNLLYKQLIMPIGII